MKMSEIKDGMKVYLPADEYGEADSGVVLLDYIDKVSLLPDCVWVKWDSDNRILQVDVEEITLVEPQEFTESEENAIMFLLKRGYTISKNQK